jgi:hypothetical protein
MLKPRERDLFLNVVDLLASNVTTLRSRVITGGFAVTVSEALFETAAKGAGNRLPAMISELLANLYHLHADDVPRTYASASKAILLNHPALELRRDFEREEAEIAAAEAATEQRKLTAKARAEAEGRVFTNGRPRKTSDARKNSAVDRSAAKARRAA